MTSASIVNETTWIDTDLAYQVALIGDNLVCRNAKGKILASVPKAVRECPAAVNLLAVRDWLAQHAASCRADAESWLLGCLPVPTTAIVEIWPDPAWRVLLDGAVVQAGDTVGFLRGAETDRGIGLVDLDGESVWVHAPTITIPHPVLLPDLADIQEFAIELGIAQGLPQLLREVFSKPPDLAVDVTEVADHSGAGFDELRQALARCREAGFRVSGGYAVCRTVADGEPTEARFWIGSDHPEAETQTGDLHWVDAQQRVLPVRAVGPVAYSEGMRMAALISAAGKSRTDS